MEGKQDEMEVEEDSWGRKERKKEIKIGYGLICIEICQWKWDEGEKMLDQVRDQRGSIRQGSRGKEKEERELG